MIISTNDLDLFIHNLLEDRISYNSNLNNHANLNYVNNLDNYIVNQFKGGKVIDNWGLDLFIGDNLQELENEINTEYLITYRRDNEALYNNKCNQKIKYDFSIMMKDCPNSKSRLNFVADKLIEYLIDPNKKYGVYQKSLSTRVDYTNNTLVEFVMYSTNLNLNTIDFRKDCVYEVIENKQNKTNFLTTVFTVNLNLQINYANN